MQNKFNPIGLLDSFKEIFEESRKDVQNNWPDWKKDYSIIQTTSSTITPNINRKDWLTGEDIE